ncbi:MAG: hypothetical protein JW819_10600 [Candidatus Krumholzibacteriota bacterium]|nr:hypothetical protein [Candidatus Krumholzibacteriota bacterium]
MRLRICLLILVVVAVLWVLGLHYDFPAFPRGGGAVGAEAGRIPPVAVDGRVFVPVVDWSFQRGPYPQGWGWGEWELAGGVLVGRHTAGAIASYFFPFDCGEEFILETRVRLTSSADEDGVVAQLLVRDSEQMHNESGVAIYADSSEAAVRHMVDGVNYIWDLIDMGERTAMNRWYRLRFALVDRHPRAWIDEQPVPLPEARYPIGLYRGPHLAVDRGTAEFTYVRVYLPE